MSGDSNRPSVAILCRDITKDEGGVANIFNLRYPTKRKPKTINHVIKQCLT